MFRLGGEENEIAMYHVVDQARWVSSLQTGDALQPSLKG